MNGVAAFFFALCLVILNDAWLAFCALKLLLYQNRMPSKVLIWDMTIEGAMIFYIVLALTKQL